MRAVDTNVLARYYWRDDPVQSPRAARVLAAGGVFVPKTVVLEIAWVLRSVAQQPLEKVASCLAHLMALPGVTLEDHEQLETALDHCRRGVDLADTLHLAASHACTEMLTFDDRRYARRATRLGLRPPGRVLKE